MTYYALDKPISDGQTHLGTRGYSLSINCWTMAPYYWQTLCECHKYKSVYFTISYHLSDNSKKHESWTGCSAYSKQKQPIYKYLLQTIIFYQSM